jgi:hypothetical protein
LLVLFLVENAFLLFGEFNYLQKLVFLNKVRALASGAAAIAAKTYGANLYRFPREFAPTVYLAGFSTFALVVLFCFVSYISADHPYKKNLSKSLMMMNFMVMSVYVLHLFKLTPVFKDENGYPVDACRYIEWLFDMDNLATIIGFVTQASSGATERAVVNAWALTIFGFLGSITKGSISQWLLLFGYGTHCISVQGLWDMYTKAADGETECQSDESMLILGRNITAYAWHACKFFYFLRQKF